LNIHIIYLAAGSARRFGSNKLLYEFNGKPLYRHGLDLLSQLIKERNDCTLTVVSRYDEILLAAEKAGAAARYCSESINGISFSIRCGIRSIASLRPEDYLVFMVAHQPYLTSETVSRLLDKAYESPLTACVCFDEQTGNPAMFSAVLAEELCALSGDRGGRAVIRNHPSSCVLVRCTSPQELEDIDTPERTR